MGHCVSIYVQCALSLNKNFLCLKILKLAGLNYENGFYKFPSYKSLCWIVFLNSLFWDKVWGIIKVKLIHCSTSQDKYSEGTLPELVLLLVSVSSAQALRLCS